MSWQTVSFNALLENGTYRLSFWAKDVPAEYYGAAVVKLFELKGQSFDVFSKRINVDNVEIETGSYVITTITVGDKEATQTGVSEAAIPFAILIEFLLALVGVVAVYLVLDKIEKLVVVASEPAIALGGFKISSLAVIGGVIVVILLFVLLK